MAVVEHGGVLKAAERLHLSQPAVSAGLKALEEELGGALFDRVGPANRPLRLTPAGRRFYRHALDILRQCEEARADFLGEGQEAPAKLRLGILDTLPLAVVAGALRHFAENAAGTRLEVWEGSADRLAAWFAQARLDAAWTYFAAQVPNSRILWREPLLAVLPPAHPAAEAGLSLRELGEFSFIHRSRCELDALGRRQLKAAGVSLRVRARVEREDLAFELVRAGMGLTLAPESLVPADLAAVPVAGLGVERTIGLHWRDEADPEPVELLADAVAAARDGLSRRPSPAAPETPDQPRKASAPESR